MQSQRTFALLGLLLGLTLTGCGTQVTDPVPTLVPKTVLVYPETGGLALICAGEPPVGEVSTDVEAVQWAEAARTAGEDCRGKLAAVRSWLAGWPKRGESP